MTSTNLTALLSVTHEACRFRRKIEWKTEFFTTTLYTNILVNAVVNALVCPVTAVFNGFYILSVFRKRHSRNHKPTVLLAFLALTDFFVGTVVQPLFVTSAVCRLTQKCTYSQAIADAACFLIALCAVSSFFHIALIAFDRYIAIKHALRYKTLVTNERCLAGTVTAWVLSVLMVCTFSYFDFAQLVSFIVLLIISAIIVWFYVVIYFESRRHHQMIITSIPLQGPAQHLSQEKEFKAFKTTSLIVGCLSICYVPSYLAQVISSFILPMNSSNVSQWLCVFLWVRTMMMVNSLCNPFIYDRRVHSHRFRETIMYIFQAFILRDKIHPLQQDNNGVHEIEKLQIISGSQRTNIISSGSKDCLSNTGVVSDGRAHAIRSFNFNGEGSKRHDKQFKMKKRK